MSERGVFAVDRGVFDHPIFKPDPFTEREAWMWLVGAAAWKPMRIRAGRASVELDRGQCAFALRFMARRFKWPEARVRRFLKRLENDAMIDTLATRETTHITICNYDKYAFGRRTSETENDAQSDAPATHDRRKEEEINNSKKETIRADARDDVSRQTIVPLESHHVAPKYVFEGVIIKLKQVHFDNWTRAFAELDVRSELTARDVWLASDRATDADRENWFISTSKYLANRNQEARSKKASQGAFKWRSGIEGVV